MNKTELDYLDMLYLFMQCDFDIAEEELAFIQKEMNHLDEKTKKIVEDRRAQLDQIIAGGFEAIREKVVELGKQVQQESVKDKERILPLKAKYMKMMLQMIYADRDVHQNESKLFEDLCRLWEMEHFIRL